MGEQFEDSIFKEVAVIGAAKRNNLIKASEANIIGHAKVSVEEDSHDGVKVILKKDTNDNIKEIKFVCSCGQTKSILLDYTE